MKNVLSLACAAVLFASPLAMAAGLTAEQIAEKNAAARGGLSAWRAVESMTLSGRMDAGGTPAVQLPFEMSLQRPHKSRLELHVKDQVAVQVYDGQQGWKQRPFLNRDDVEAFTPQETQAAADDADLDGPLIDHARKGTRIELAGTDTIEGRKAYRLRLTRADGRQSNLWIDTGTFLDVKMDGEPRRLDNKVHKVSVFYRDYKSVGGLKMPMTLETVVDGVRPSRKITFQNVAVNPKLAETLFVKPQPAQVKQASAR
jgi:outer membrane lipoprotein-sorting protein